MDKKLVGKYAGLTGAVALVLTVICQITHDGGIPWNTFLIATVIHEKTNINIFYMIHFHSVLLRGLKDE